MKYYIVLLLLIQSLSLKALPIDSLTLAKLESGILYMENNQHEKAINTFIEIMTPGVVLPNEVCFFMGNCLFQSGRSSHSIRFLDKYLQLTDTTGAYYKETIALLEKMGFKTPETVKAEEKHEKEHPYISVQDDPCQGKEEVLCPLCSGTGVIIKKSKYGTVYKTCLYSDEHGLMDCERYRSYLEGELIEYVPK